jgi:hypothetical protein
MSYYPSLEEMLVVQADRKVTGSPESGEHVESLLAIAKQIQHQKGWSFDRAWAEAVSQLAPEVNDSSKKPETLSGTNVTSYTERNFRDFSVKGIRTKVD